MEILKCNTEYRMELAYWIIGYAAEQVILYSLFCILYSIYRSFEL